MKKVLFATAAAVALSSSFASAEILTGSTDNDQKLWINTSQGRLVGSAARTYDAQIASSTHEAGTMAVSRIFLLDSDDNGHKQVVNQYAPAN